MMDGLGNRKMFTAAMTALSLTDHLTRARIIHSQAIFIGDIGALFARDYLFKESFRKSFLSCIRE